MNGLIPIPVDSSYNEEINKAMKVSIQSLVSGKHIKLNIEIIFNNYD